MEGRLIKSKRQQQLLSNNAMSDVILLTRCIFGRLVLVLGKRVAQSAAVMGGVIVSLKSRT